MQLLLVRHAIAEDRDEFRNRNSNDWERPLTKAGRERMEKLSGEYASLVKSVDLLCHSPLVRARQTAEILAKDLKPRYTVESDTLTPESDPQDFLRWLADYAKAELVVAVGHEPQLSDLASVILLAQKRPMFGFKKGGACLIDLSRGPVAGAGALVWLVTPRVLLR
jgi:phosphohistidine phosphatase